MAMPGAHTAIYGAVLEDNLPARRKYTARRRCGLPKLKTESGVLRRLAANEIQTIDPAPDSVSLNVHSRSVNGAFVDRATRTFASPAFDFGSVAGELAVNEMDVAERIARRAMPAVSKEAAAGYIDVAERQIGVVATQRFVREDLDSVSTAIDGGAIGDQQPLCLSHDANAVSPSVFLTRQVGLSGAVAVDRNVLDHDIVGRRGIAIDGKYGVERGARALGAQLEIAEGHF